ncbi:MAG: RagB/SusD family nutrient uptake outer membrane protein, partial [Pedobacter sp.]
TSTLFNREIIFATSAPAVNTIERNNAPIGYTGGLGRTNPTQELVDAFDMSNGTERLAPGSTYSDSNPYANRDARLGFFIVVNGSTFRTGSITRPTEIFDGGQDNILDNINRPVCTTTINNPILKKIPFLAKYTFNRGFKS